MEQSDALVLRVYPWSETSCVANIYTRDFGKRSVLAKGARRPKSPFEAALDLLSICHVVFIPKSADSLDILTEAKLIRRFRAGNRDWLRLNCGFYVSELLDRLTDQADHQPELYELALATLFDLDDTQRDPRAIVLRWELQMLRMVGHLPSWQQCATCGDKVLSDEREASGTSRGIVFSPISGGVLCERCRITGRQTIRIDEETCRVFMAFSGPNWIDVPSVVPRSKSGLIRRVMTQYLNVTTDRKFQLHGFLEELGR